MDEDIVDPARECFDIQMTLMNLNDQMKSGVDIDRQDIMELINVMELFIKKYKRSVLDA